MAEFIKKKVQPIKVIAKCDCGGEFEPTGMCLATYPYQYPHICNKCGKSETFKYTFPKIEFEGIDTRTLKIKGW